MNELQEIASEPDSTHVYNVAEFDLMHTVVESLTRTVCSRVEEQDREIKGTRVTGSSLLAVAPSRTRDALTALRHAFLKLPFSLKI